MCGEDSLRDYQMKHLPCMIKEKEESPPTKNEDNDHMPKGYGQFLTI